jgi:hypothetical protein
VSSAPSFCVGGVRGLAEADTGGLWVIQGLLWSWGASGEVFNLVPPARPLTALRAPCGE